MLSFFRDKKVNQIISWIVLAAFLNLIHGCYFYKVNESKLPAETSLVKFQSDKKFIILHNGQSVWHFTGIVVSEDSVRGTIAKLVGHNLYKTTKPEDENRYKKTNSNDESGVLNEVHIYINEFTQHSDNHVSIPLASIKRIDVYDPAKGATVASWVFGIAGTIAAVVAVVVIIVALTKESCPFIYVDSDSSSVFVGEIYSGAIYPSLERPDYLPLPSPLPGQKDYTIRMTNEVHEIQNTNLIELNVIDHPKGTNAYIDKYGNYQTTGLLQSPLNAADLKGRNILDVIRAKDSLTYSITELGKDPPLTNGIIMAFDRPQNSNIAKLVVNARSTYWLDYTFTRFHELFGREYDCWVDKQQTVSPLKMKTWMLEQNIPLSLYVEKNGKWKFVDYYNIVGPMALKEDILSFDISEIKTDKLRVKLEYGNLFWEVDYAAVDYSVNVPVKQRIAQLGSAIDNKDTDVKNLLAAPDLLYYVQPEIGDAVNMSFTLPDQTDSERTLILHSQGHYRILLNLSGEQQKKELLTFMKKGRFPEFSNEIFQAQSGYSRK
jgi:hypothetical protein